MIVFPVWFLQILVIGALVLCSAGVAALIVFLSSDSKNNRIW